MELLTLIKQARERKAEHLKELAKYFNKAVREGTLKTVVSNPKQDN